MITSIDAKSIARRDKIDLFGHPNCFPSLQSSAESLIAYIRPRSGSPSMNPTCLLVKSYEDIVEVNREYRDSSTGKIDWYRVNFFTFD